MGLGNRIQWVAAVVVHPGGRSLSCLLTTEDCTRAVEFHQSWGSNCPAEAEMGGGGAPDVTWGLGSGHWGSSAGRPSLRSSATLGCAYTYIIFWGYREWLATGRMSRYLELGLGQLNVSWGNRIQRVSVVVQPGGRSLTSLLLLDTALTFLAHQSVLDPGSCSSEYWKLGLKKDGFITSQFFNLQDHETLLKIFTPSEDCDKVSVLHLFGDSVAIFGNGLA